MPSDPFRSILLTGADGLVGSAMSDSLRARKINFAPLTHSECDVTNANAVSTTFEKFKPTLVINCAAYTKVDAAEREPELANAINGFALKHIGDAGRSH